METICKTCYRGETCMWHKLPAGDEPRTVCNNYRHRDRAFHVGIFYVFRAALYDADQAMQDGNPRPDWVGEMDGRLVSIVTDMYAACNGYLVHRDWCEEVE